MTTTEFETLQKEILKKGKRVSTLEWTYNDYILTFDNFGITTKIKTPEKTFVWENSDFGDFLKEEDNNG